MNNNKVGRPKLADDKLKKSSIKIIVAGLVFCVLMLIITPFVLSGVNPKDLLGKASSCYINITNLSQTTASFDWSCTSGKIKSYTVYNSNKKGDAISVLAKARKSAKKSKINITGLSSSKWYLISVKKSDGKVANKLIRTYGNFLISLNKSNVDKNYMGSIWQVDDKDALLRVISREFENDLKGDVLTAQAIRDCMMTRGYHKVSDIYGNNRCGYTKSNHEITVEARKAYKYVFEQGNSAVQHRITNYTTPKDDANWINDTEKNYNFIYRYKGKTTMGYSFDVKFYDNKTLKNISFY